MRLRDLRDKEGRVFAFEVSSFFRARADICQVASSIPGARILKEPRILSWVREDVFCEFEVDGVIFAAWEPFGDNDHYWIGPEPPVWVPQISAVRDVFERS